MEIDVIRNYASAIQAMPAQERQLQTAESAPIQPQAAVDKEISTVSAQSPIQRSASKDDEKGAVQDRRQEAEASDKMLKTAMDIANKQLKHSNRMIQANFHEKTKRIMVKVVDTDTDEVIREIPPEKTLDLFAKVLEMAGILLDEKK